MKSPFYLILLIFLCGCAPDEELSSIGDSGDVDARLNFYWDRYDAHYSSNPDSALFYMQKVKSLAEAKDKQKWIASAYGAIADIQKEKGNLGEAVYHLLYAAKIYQEIGELSRMAKAFNSIGYVFMRAKNYETALSYFQKAGATYFYKGNGDEKALVAINLGICYREMGKEEEAEAVLVSGLEDARDPMLRSKINNTLGVLFFEQGMQEKAREHYFLSMQSIGPGMDSVQIVASAYNNIGETYLEERDFGNAEKWLNKGLMAKKEINDPIIVLSIINSLGKLKMEQGRYREAIHLIEEGLKEIDTAAVDFAVGESLSLINEALVKFERIESGENLALLNRQLFDYNQRLLLYNQQLMKMKERLDMAEKQAELALSADKFEQDLKLGVAKEEKEQIKLAAFLIFSFLLLIGAFITFWFVRKQRRSKAIMGAIEEVLNKSTMRHSKH